MEVFHAARPAQKPGGAPGSRSHPAWPLQVWVLETVAILARQGAGQKLECWARLEVEGGSAQKGDDITTQPLKDELFPLPLQLRSGGSWEDWGPGAASLDQGATGVSSIMLQTRWVLGGGWRAGPDGKASARDWLGTVREPVLAARAPGSVARRRCVGSPAPGRSRLGRGQHQGQGGERRSCSR